MADRAAWVGFARQVSGAVILMTGEKRIISFDIRPSSLGFVVFEGPERLLDWGAKSFRGGMNAVQEPAAAKLRKLFDEFAPAAAVLRETTDKASSKLVSTLLREARRHRVAIKPISRREVQKTFAGHTRNKYEVAGELAKRFGELAWMLPPKRKPWQSEDYRMRIFDAAALGTAYFARSAARDSPPLPPQ